MNMIKTNLATAEKPTRRPASSVLFLSAGGGILFKEKSMDKLKWMDEWLPIAIGIMLLFMVFAPICHADTLPKERVVMAAIGEAEGGGLEGMRCVISAIFNRGTLKGVYGERAPRVLQHKYSPRTFVLAVQAYEEAIKHDYSNGATHWEGVSFKTPYWAKSMTEVMVVGGNRFYR